MKGSGPIGQRVSTLKICVFDWLLPRYYGQVQYGLFVCYHILFQA